MLETPRVSIREGIVRATLSIRAPKSVNASRTVPPITRYFDSDLNGDPEIPRYSIQTFPPLLTLFWIQIFNRVCFVRSYETYAYCAFVFRFALENGESSLLLDFLRYLIYQFFSFLIQRIWDNSLCYMFMKALLC